ncbi:MAG: hypothetical protein ACFFE2_16185 [Candidatus Thorarchaeota archaeon]
MKMKLSILLVMCALIVGSASSVVAVTNHNLEWGCEVGDRFHYRYSGNGGNEVIEFFVEIDSLPVIPSDVVSYFDIMISSLYYTCYYENGTEMLMSLPWAAVPIGNWQLVQDFVNETSPNNMQWINTLSEWGAIIVEQYSTVTRTSTIKFSKTDGVMTYYRIVEDSTEGPTVTMMEVTRSGLQSVPSTLILQMVSIGSVIAIVIVIVLIFMSKNKATVS